MKQPEGDIAAVMNRVMRQKLTMRNLRAFFKNEVIQQLWWGQEPASQGYFFSRELQTEIIDRYLPDAKARQRILKHLDQVCQFRDVINI